MQQRDKQHFPSLFWPCSIDCIDILFLFVGFTDRFAVKYMSQYSNTPRIEIIVVFKNAQIPSEPLYIQRGKNWNSSLNAINSLATAAAVAVFVIKSKSVQNAKLLRIT